METLLTEAMEKNFDARLIPGELAERELELRKEYHNQLVSDESIFGRTEKGWFGTPPPNVKRFEVCFKVFQGPFVRLTMLLDPADKVIHDLMITGAIHVLPLTPQTSPIHEMERRLKGVSLREEDIRAKVDEVFNLPGYEIVGATAEDFVKHIVQAVSVVSG